MGGVDVADKEEVIDAAINEIYGIASELSISTDKAVQEYGKQLRKLIEQLNNKLTQTKTAE
jgi:hypothetical protein